MDVELDIGGYVVTMKSGNGTTAFSGRGRLITDISTRHSNSNFWRGLRDPTGEEVGNYSGVFMP